MFSSKHLKQNTSRIERNRPIFDYRLRNQHSSSQLSIEQKTENQEDYRRNEQHHQPSEMN